MNTYNVITLFPKLVEEWKNIGIVRQAIKNELVNIQTTDLREYGIGDYKQVDDSDQSYFHFVNVCFIGN